MKQFFSLFILVLFVGAKFGFSQAPAAHIAFETLEYDYGTFNEEKGIQSYDFKFKNTGGSPLILNSVVASCGCTTPDWTRKPVAPGESGTIKVSYDPKNRPGAFNKTIRVSSNADNAEVTLRISGKVEPRQKTIAEEYPREIGPLRARSNQISFVKILQTEVLKDSIEVINDSAAPVQLSFKTPPAHIQAKFVPSKLEPKQKGYLVVTYDASKLNTFGFVMHRLYLNIDGQSDYKNSVGVSATIEEDFSKLSPEELKNAPVAQFSEMTFDFGDIKQGDKVEHTFTLKNTGKRDLIIRNVKTSCGCTAVSPEKNIVPAGDSVPLKVEFNSAGKLGRQNKTITVITNDPKNPTTILRIASNILGEG